MSILSRHMLIPVLIALAAIYFIFPERWVNQLPGILVPKEPIQKDLPAMQAFEYKDHYITPLSEYDITARVLAKRRYYFDREAKISPVDFTLGWLKMSDSEILDHFSFNLSGRYYISRYDLQRVLRYMTSQQVHEQTANTHIIPATDEIAKEIKRVRAGHIIHMQGYLVRAEGKDNFRWESSLSRTDAGWNACELMFVKKVEIIK